MKTVSYSCINSDWTTERRTIESSHLAFAQRRRFRHDDLCQNLDSDTFQLILSKFNFQTCHFVITNSLKQTIEFTFSLILPNAPPWLLKIHNFNSTLKKKSNTIYYYHYFYQKIELQDLIEAKFSRVAGCN